MRELLVCACSAGILIGSLAAACAEDHNAYGPELEGDRCELIDHFVQALDAGIHARILPNIRSIVKSARPKNLGKIGAIQ